MGPILTGLKRNCFLNFVYEYIFFCIEPNAFWTVYFIRGVRGIADHLVVCVVIYRRRTRPSFFRFIIYYYYYIIFIIIFYNT